jgi:hypothetical protein
VIVSLSYALVPHSGEPGSAAHLTIRRGLRRDVFEMEFAGWEHYSGPAYFDHLHIRDTSI